MKILRCIHSLDPAIGGPLESLRQSSVVLMQRGHAVEVLSLDAPDAPGVREFPANVHAFGPGRGSYGYTPGLVRWLQQRSAEYDTVIVHGIWQYHSLAVWRALHNGATPYFVFPHGMLDPWFNRTYRLKHLKKLLYWPWAEYRVLRDATAVLFTSEEEKRLARQSFSRYRCKEVVVNYGTAAPPAELDSARAEFFARFPALRDKRLVLFLGRLHEKKGCDLAVKAFAASAARTHQLVLAGPAASESYRAELQKLANSLTERVTFTGMLTGSLKWGALAAAEAFILPSHQENFGIAVVEALACGTPVLISNQVNIWREVVADGGGFAEQDNLEGTKRLLTRWLETPAERRAEMSRKAGLSFARRFEVNQAVDSFLEVLQNAVSRRPVHAQ